MITRIPVVDDTGDGRSGTPINAAWWTQVQNMIDARWSSITLAGLTGNNDNVAINEADIVYVQPSGIAAILGIVAPANPAKPGKVLQVVNAGFGEVLLYNDYATSTDVNQLSHYTSQPLRLTRLTSATYVYAVFNRWLLIGTLGGTFFAP